MKIFLVFFSFLLLYFLWEKRTNEKCLRSFKAVVHVNGIRGKTSTCRYIDAALRSRYRVFTKTTGTDAKMIDVSGTERRVKRLGPANIHEQLRTIRRAAREGAEVLVLECMAVNPDLQRTAQEQIVKSGITVITNVRYDHIFEMGQSLPEIAASLSVTIPENGTLYTAEPRAEEFFGEKCREKHCKLVTCPALGTRDENIGIARAVSASLGVTEEEFQRSLPLVKEDFGASMVYETTNSQGRPVRFLNLFSANDPQSTRNNVEKLRKPGETLYFLYNHRGDRPDRALLFARCFFPYFKEAAVFVSGSGGQLAKSMFEKAGVRHVELTRDLNACLDLPESSLLVGIGNIKGAGYAMIEQLEKGSTVQ